MQENHLHYSPLDGVHTKLLFRALDGLDLDLDFEKIMGGALFSPLVRRRTLLVYFSSARGGVYWQNQCCARPLVQPNVYLTPREKRRKRNI